MGDAAAMKALSPRRSAFKGLLKKGTAGGKENSCGQISTDSTKLQQQLQMQSQALSDVAAAAGCAPVSEGSDLRVLCMQVCAAGSSPVPTMNDVDLALSHFVSPSAAAPKLLADLLFSCAGSYRAQG